jgi:hypothetical protein
LVAKQPQIDDFPMLDGFQRGMEYPSHGAADLPMGIS